MSFYNELKKFISQSKSGELTTSQYLNEYEGLKVKVSFGQGNQAKVPWIAFLGENNTVQNGIYPVYLFFKERDLLILSYGVSETTESVNQWPNNKLETISEFFRKKKLEKPERYGDSFVYMSYDTTKKLDESQINNNLSTVISTYKKNLKNDNTPNIIVSDFNYKTFHEKTKESKLQFSEKIIARFVASLCAKPFVICTGLSGSGKTKLAQSFAQWICNDEEQYKIIPVGADWTNREPLLGYPNALNEKQYIKPDNGAIDLIMRAISYSHLPHFLILDEMNLSHVERYFADFLSCMESEAPIPLHSSKEGKSDSDGNIIPNEIKLPSNLFIIGTVNIDETTYMFSPKVLDRANVIEFRITNEEINEYLKNPSKPQLKLLTTKGSEMGPDFVTIARKSNFESQDAESINEVLVSFFDQLKKCGAEFGYRTASEISRLIGSLSYLDNTISKNTKIDIAIMQKLLPKLHGSRSKLIPVLTSLAKLCITDAVRDFESKDEDFRKAYLTSVDKIENKEKITYPVSFEKISNMYKNAIDNGFTSYAEA